MFEKGQTVLYGQTGVCTVEDIAEKELVRNQKRLYYVLKPYFQQNNTIYAPADSDKVFIRPVMTAPQADELILKIPEIKAKIKNAEITQEECRTALSSHSCDDLVRLTAKIYEKKKSAQAEKKKLGFSDEKYLHLAEELLFGELSVALGIPRDSVQDYIKQKIEKI